VSARDELTMLVLGKTAPRAADAIVAAGYRKPRTITTIGNLAGEPDGTVIRTAHGKTMELLRGHWQTPDSKVWWSPLIDWLPATVLHEPEATA
jgi:hypothetical protein